MNSSGEPTVNPEVLLEQGRAIARGIDELNIQKTRNTAREAKRQQSMLRNAAEKEMFK